MAATGAPPDAGALGLDLLGRLASEFPPRYLSPAPELSLVAREASALLFKALLPSCRKPLPIDRLIVGEAFDAEQIWHQIDLQSLPLSLSLRKELSGFEKMGYGEIKGLFGVGIVNEEDEKEEERGGEGNEELHDNEEDDIVDEDDEDDDDDRIGEDEEDGEGKGGVLDDGFFKGEELEEFLDKEDEREFGGKHSVDEEEDEDDDQTDDDDDEENDNDDGAYARYEDFFGKKKGMEHSKGLKRNKKQRMKSKNEDYEWDMQEMREESLEGSDDDNGKHDDNTIEDGDNGALSTFERQSKKDRCVIEQIEKELLAPKHWTMIGEVTASKRPKNSALEVDLDFQHNKVRPPVSIEENAVAIEDLIIKRLCEGPGHLDEVQRPVLMDTKAPRELKELDDKKSQKGLAEIYEEDYVQKTGIGTAPPVLDEQKKEANLLFKLLCTKLDALSHFHFRPKPVLEEMSIQINVPALAMEEIAPLAVSDAAMLAPEEIFVGKGDIKEDVELTQTDRKHRRAKKKRKFKAESVKRIAKRPQKETSQA